MFPHHLVEMKVKFVDVHVYQKPLAQLIKHLHKLFLPSLAMTSYPLLLLKH